MDYDISSFSLSLSRPSHYQKYFKHEFKKIHIEIEIIQESLLLSSHFPLIFFLEAQCPLYDAFMSINDLGEDSETKSVNVQGSWIDGEG